MSEKPGHELAGLARVAERDGAVLVAVDDVGDRLPHADVGELRVGGEVVHQGRTRVHRRTEDPEAGVQERLLAGHREAVGRVVDVLVHHRRGDVGGLTVVQQDLAEAILSANRPLSFLTRLIWELVMLFVS